MPLHILRTSTPRPRVPEAQLGFGQVFTDHMLLMDYTPQAGWHQARIEPYGPFLLEPSTIVFHYGQAIFDGLTAIPGERKNPVITVTSGWSFRTPPCDNTPLTTTI